VKTEIISFCFVLIFKEQRSMPELEPLLELRAMLALDFLVPYD
jgi:hypothetical protein